MATQAAHMADAGPSSFQLRQASPLETLVRRTSRKQLIQRRDERAEASLAATERQDNLVNPYDAYGGINDGGWASQPASRVAEKRPVASSSHGEGQTGHAPRSKPAALDGAGYHAPPVPPEPEDPYTPILHSRFPGSQSTANTAFLLNNNFNNSRSFLTFADDQEDLPEPDATRSHRDDASVYSNLDDPNWRASNFSQATTEGLSALSAHLATRFEPVQDPIPEEQPQRRPSPPPMHARSSPVPTVVVSSPDILPGPPHPLQFPPSLQPSFSSRTPVANVHAPVTNGRAPIAANQPRFNYSRPGRPPIISSDEQKRQGLERNAQRANSPYAENSFTSSPASASPYSARPEYFDSPPRAAPAPYSPSTRSVSPRSPSPQGSHQWKRNVPQAPPPPAHAPPQAPPPRASPQQQAMYSSSYLKPPSPMSPATPSTSSSMASSTATSQIVIPKHPPSFRADSPTSLYSNSYSFYQLDEGGGNRSSPSSSGTRVDRHRSSPLASPAGGTFPRSGSGTPNGEPQSALEFLQLGIQAHEGNKLRDSAVYFEQSATVQGGCGVGMLMWGLALRHGWGCQKNEKVGFKWLTKAAESAVGDLESAREGLDIRVVKTELVLAIYEVGQCFFQGWGVTKDQKMAVSYYRVAANLGDADAQQDLAFCLANGKGCKKDKKEAAKWYRAAVAQGASDVGLAWIYKPKYSS